MGEDRGFGRNRTIIAAGAVAVLLCGCALPPATEGWTPPAWSDAVGISAADAQPGEGQELNDLGFVQGRIRNDAAGYQARYVEIPGAAEFNSRIEALIRGPLDGVDFQPEAFAVGSGLGERGCVPGSMDWDAERVLSDPATGPVAGTGTAITCEVIAAFGTTVGVALRTVTGSGGSPQSDQKTTLYVDLSTGAVTDSTQLWTPQAAADLWTRAMEYLRRQSGGLSAAPLQPPADEQVALAAQAFGYTTERDDGSFVLTLPRGLASPELAGLGIDQTAEPTTLAVSGDVAANWQSDQAASVYAQQGTAFTGLPQWTPGSTPIDCALLSCVAVTYDDGPGPYTIQLLDTLRAEQAGATFFEQGINVQSNPDITKAVVEAGQEIGSHTMTHADLTKIPLSGAVAEVNRAADLIAGVTGRPVTLYRPPYGATNSAVLGAVGKPAILWSIDTNDWQNPGPQALIDRSVPVAKPGAIILFHDVHVDSVTTAPQILEGLADRGFTMVTVSQLFGGSVPQGVVRNR